MPGSCSAELWSVVLLVLRYVSCPTHIIASYFSSLVVNHAICHF